MTLRTKIAAAVLVLASVLVGIQFAVKWWIIYPGFAEMERADAEDSADRCVRAIEREIEHFSVYTHDWSSWSDAYRFVRKRNEEFVRTNLTLDSFHAARCNMRIFLDERRRVVYGRILDFETGEEHSIADVPTSGQWPADHWLLAHPSSDAVIEGALATPHGALLICSRKILKSDGSGPAAGTLIQGRFLDHAAIRRLHLRRGGSVTVLPLNEASSPRDREAAARVADGQPAVFNDSDSIVSAYGVLNDVRGRPAFLVRTRLPREYSTRGIAALNLAAASMIAAIGLGAAALLFMLQRLVAGPLTQLTVHVTRVSTSGDLTNRLRWRRQDEIGRLAAEFDNLTARLDNARTSLADTSRRAGMADMARGILHNVGNVLNSLNVSTDLLSDLLRDSRLPGLTRAGALLEEHAGDLPRFLTEDERGRQLPHYMSSLADVLRGEQESLARELASLRTGLEHVNEIVRTQHELAASVSSPEPTSARALIDCAFAMVHAGFDRHGIRVTLDIAEVPTLLLDRSKALQILINLLTNAKESVAHRRAGERSVTLRAACRDNVVEFEVRDNGVGISTSDVARIFAAGVSSKPGGRGYGLHYSANAAREMGGRLRVHSDGPDRGATFVLEVPIAKPQEASGT
jgi:two-component system, NtrC family, sensor kinase